MGKRCLTISLPEELVDKLLADAEEAEVPFEEYIEQLLANSEIDHENQAQKIPPPEVTSEQAPKTSLPSSDNSNKAQTSENTFSSVALIKEEPEPETVVLSLSQPERALIADKTKISPSSFSYSNSAAKVPNPRKLQLEAEMKELSLLIETAIESEKKQQYVMKYAMLAAELDALL